MGQQDEDTKHHAGQPATDGSGASGEGAGSALEAMLKKRREHVHPAPAPVAPAAEPPHGGSSKPLHRPDS